MIEQINAVLPTIILIGALLVVIAFIARFYKRLPEVFEDNYGKLSSKRIGAIGFTAWTFTLLARDVTIPMEAWMLVGLLWGLKTWQRRIENGGGRHAT